MKISILNKIIEILDNENINLNSQFEDLQLTSLEYVEMYVCIEEIYGFEFDLDDMVIGKFVTIENFIDKICEYITM